MWGVDGWFDGWILGSKPSMVQVIFSVFFFSFFLFTDYLCVCLLSFIYRSETMTPHYAPFEANTQRAPKEPD